MASTGRKPVIVEREVLRDSRTGRELWRVSPADRPCAAGYMYITSFTPDERYLVYVADIGGSKQLYRLEIATGETLQLTEFERPRALGGWNLHPSGSEVFAWDGSRCVAIHIETLEERIALDPSRHDWLRNPEGSPMFSPSGKYFSLWFTHGPDHRGVARAACDGSGAEEVFRRDSRLNHVQYCPASDDLVSFVAQPDLQNDFWRSDRERAHVWLVDCRTKTAEPVLIAPKGFRVTHSYWSPGGERIYYHRKTVPTWVPTWIGWKDVKTGETREFYGSETVRLGHSFATRDEKWVVTDSQDPGTNPLVLIELASGRGEVLCWPDSRNRENAPGVFGNHVHPSFSPSGRYVLFTSDSTGIPQVYLVPRW